MMAGTATFLLFIGAGLSALALDGPSAAPVATGFYHTIEVGSRWEFVDPQGRLFLSCGVDAVRHHQDELFGTHDCPFENSIVAQYGTIENWQKLTASNLISWGFNTLGARSDDDMAKIEIKGEHLAYTPVIDFGANFVQAKVQSEPMAYSWRKGVFADVFDPEFTKSVQLLAESRCAPLKNDPQLLGWFTDNEMRWGPDWRGRNELLVEFLNFSLHTPGRDAALALLEKRYGDVGKFNEVWGTSFASWDKMFHAPRFATPPRASRKGLYLQNGEVDRPASDQKSRAFVDDCDAFLAQLADRYFKITTEAIRAVDPHHLILGCRFAYVPAPPVVAAAGRYLDVISFNCYDKDPTRALDSYAVTHKPLLIGEFGFRARDSGLPNSRGAGPLVPTQEDRARCIDLYLHAAFSHPNFVGYQWFKLADEPAEGRFDGEDSNYGIVDINNRPYNVMVKVMTKDNGEGLLVHSSAR